MVALPFHHVGGTAHFILASVGDGAGSNSFDQAEAFVFDTLGDQVGQDLGMESGAARNKGSAGRFDQLGYVEVLFDRRIRSCRRFGACRCQRRILAAGHTVNTVVVKYDGHIDVAAGSVDQVVAADRCSVAVAGNDDYSQAGVSQFNAGRYRQSASMCGMDCIEI